MPNTRKAPDPFPHPVGWVERSEDPPGRASNRGQFSAWFLDGEVIKPVHYNIMSLSNPEGLSFTLLMTADDSTVQLLVEDTAGRTGTNYLFFNAIEIRTVPEPATCALTALALAALGGYVRRRRKTQIEPQHASSEEHLPRSRAALGPLFVHEPRQSSSMSPAMGIYWVAATP